MSVSLAVAGSASGCAAVGNWFDKDEPVVRATTLLYPPVYEYSAAFRSKLDEELTPIMGPDDDQTPSCPRDRMVRGCSAVLTFAEDYVITLERLEKAIEIAGEPRN